MRNLSNLLAIFVLVAMMGLLVGCGCTTNDMPLEEDMVDTGEEVLPSPGTTGEEILPNPNSGNMENTIPSTDTIVDEQGNLIDENTAADGVSDNTTPDGTHSNGIIDDVGNVIDDAAEGAGNAVEDMGRGIKNMTDDLSR